MRSLRKLLRFPCRHDPITGLLEQVGTERALQRARCSMNRWLRDAECPSGVGEIPELDQFDQRSELSGCDMSEQLLALANVQLGAAQFLHGFTKLSQGALDAIGADRPGRGGVHARAAAGEERNAEMPLDGSYRLRDRGLG